MITNLDTLYDVLVKVLDPEMESLMKMIASKPSGERGSDYMMLPDASDAHLSSLEVSRLIALSSNKYALATRLAGIARSKAKIAEAKYKYKFRTSLNNGAKNSQEREAVALEAAEQEYQEMVLAQVIVELCESIESSNRIASESSRRMLLAAEQAAKAEHRYNDHSGALDERDFTNAW